MPPSLTSLYAPQARLIDLATGTIVGATRATSDATAAVVPDIVSAKITLTSSGVGQVQITLNNQRFLDAATPWPPWKYNDFSPPPGRDAPTNGLGSIRFGQLFRVDFRYGEGTWIKMMIAQVNDLQYTFPQSGGAQVVVIGEDLLCRLKVRPTANVTHSNRQEEEIVQAVLDATFTEANAKPRLQLLGNSAQQEGRTLPITTVTHDKAQTYYQFLTGIARRLDYELFLEFRDVRAAAVPATATQVSPGPISARSEHELWFQPARSGFAPQGDKQSGLEAGAEADAPMFVHYELRWGLNLIELSPRFKVFDMPTSAEATGTYAGARARSTERLTEDVLVPLMNAELPASSNYGVTMQDALTARRTYFGDAGPGAETAESSPATNLDPPRLRLKARAEFMARVREFQTADGWVIGLPRLRPGQYVDIVGLRPPFDGYYYITKTVHTLDDSGYRTQFTVRRPGMQPPQRYLSASPPTAIAGTPPPAPEPAAPGGSP